MIAFSIKAHSNLLVEFPRVPAVASVLSLWSLDVLVWKLMKGPSLLEFEKFSHRHVRRMAKLGCLGKDMDSQKIPRERRGSQGG